MRDRQPPVPMGACAAAAPAPGAGRAGPQVSELCSPGGQQGGGEAVIASLCLVPRSLIVPFALHPSHSLTVTRRGRGWGVLSFASSRGGCVSTLGRTYTSPASAVFLWSV